MALAPRTRRSRPRGGSTLGLPGIVPHQARRSVAPDIARRHAGRRVQWVSSRLVGLPGIVPHHVRRSVAAPTLHGCRGQVAALDALPAGAFAVLAPWPAAGPTLALFQLFLGPANATCSGHLLLGILDPADELVAGQRRDVPPSIECCRVGDQRAAQICGKSVHHPARHSLAAHRCQRYGVTARPMSESYPGVRPAITRPTVGSCRSG